MKKLVVFLLSCVMLPTMFGVESTLLLTGRVKESLGKTDLIKAMLLSYDADGNVRDTIRANQGYYYRNGAIDTLSFFYMSVPRVDSTYVFDIVCEGYKTLPMSYTVDKIGKRERKRDLGMIYLDRAPVMLKEVTVTTSKIKFYNDGDTVVYNADAFQLAEGSMLDALIAQLPGVELNTDGQIKVNGEFVESLLLNGKQFFDGNNNLMLENIGAYAVKDIKVYEAAKQKDRQMGNDTKKVLTMNVQLKKEYNIGWLVNAQGGYGTDDRYLGRLFASWFNPTTRISLAANLNNLNSNRKPGRDDTWTPDQMPDGTKSYVMAGLNYDYEHPEGKRSADGDIMFSQEINNVASTMNRINFIPGGNTYDNSFSKSHLRNTHLSTTHYFYNKFSKVLSWGIDVHGDYRYSKAGSESLSGSFSKDPGEMTSEILDAIYSSGSPEMLESIMNRSKTKSDSWNRGYTGAVSTFLNVQLPRSSERLFARLQAHYTGEKGETWRDYDINYGPTTLNAERLRQYTDNSPNHNMQLIGTVGYMFYGDNFNFRGSYAYRFTEKKKNSSMYALDRLNDMGIYGIVPEDYLLAFDPANSYASTTFTGEHMLAPTFWYNHQFKNNSSFILSLDPQLSLEHRKFNYWSNGVDHKISKTFATIEISGYMGAMVQYSFNMKGEGRQQRARNTVRYSYSITPTVPDLIDMIDVDNTADPLNIYLGNPDLRTAWRHRHLFRWGYTPHSHPTFMNVLYASYTHARNSLTRGYVYDTATGIRINKMYNVDGNYTWAVTNELNWQFGSTKQFVFTSMTDGVLATYNDMIGTIADGPQKVTVKNSTLTENIKLGWRIGKQNLSLRCDFTTRHTTSEQPGFNTINATHVNYGVSGVFTLPKGFGISTDFVCYSRRGYGVKHLDTTDPVWNMRVSYAPPGNKHWIFMLDGFDMLHQLSNINYAVTASGRTVSYTNTIPRYIMLSVQYRLNIQPKKK